jgi:hypothetical protein
MKMIIITADETITESDYDEFDLIVQADTPSNYSILATKNGNETKWDYIREDELFRKIKQIMWSKT